MSTIYSVILKVTPEQLTRTLLMIYPSSSSTEISIYLVYLEGEKNSSAMKWKRNHSHGCQPLKRQLLDLTFIFSAKLGKIKKGGIQYW